jgi:hypothetical protein
MPAAGSGSIDRCIFTDPEGVIAVHAVEVNSQIATDEIVAREAPSSRHKAEMGRKWPFHVDHRQCVTRKFVCLLEKKQHASVTQGSVTGQKRAAGSGSFG